MNKLTKVILVSLLFTDYCMSNRNFDEPIFERDKERGRRCSHSATSRTNDAVAAKNRPPEGKPSFRPSAALLLLGVVQRLRLRRRALHTAKIRLSKFPITYAIVSIIILSFLLSPFISLILPNKLKYYEYRKLVDRVIANKETAACVNDEQKVNALFNYVVDHEFLQGEPYSCKPLESLIYGEAFCDFQARTLNVLLAAAGIQSRYAMLLNKDGISPHTLNEVFLDDKWSVYDTSFNLIFRNTKEEKFSLQEASNNFNLLYTCPKLAALKEYDNEKYINLMEFYSTVLPLPAQPRRSTPILLQAHIFDKITDLYFKLFKYKFFNLYQDLYLRGKAKTLAQDDAKFFYLARNYHLAYRNNLALDSYQALIKRYSSSKYIEDAIFFCGMLYFEEKDYPKAIELFKQVIDKYRNKWKNASYYYLGKVYEAIGDEKRSLLSYSQTTIEKLPASTILKLVKFKQEMVKEEKNKRVSFLKKIRLFFSNIFKKQKGE